MSGGQWTDTNKVLPGIYIRYYTKANTQATVGSRGVVAIGKQLSWGPYSEIIEITDTNKIKNVLGFDISDERAMFIREIVRGSNLTRGATKILLGRLKETGGSKSAVTIGNLTATAKYEGLTGNKLSIVVSPILATEHETKSDTYYQWKVETLLDMTLVAEEIVGTFVAKSDPGNVEAKIEDLVGNDWVDFSGTGEFEANVGSNLTGGKDGNVAEDAHSEFLTKLGKKTFNVVIYDGTDTITKGLYKNFVDRLCKDEGRYVVGVMENYTSADSEYIISVNNGVTIDTGDKLTPDKCTWWVGGASGGANYNESLTYHTYPGATAVEPEYENSELAELLQKGNFLFFKLEDQIMVLSDVNSFTSFMPEKSRSLSKNRVIRTIMQICNDLYVGYTKQYIGKVDVNDKGLALVKSYGINYLLQIQTNNGIKNFDSESDYIVKEFEIDSMKVDMYVQPVDSLEKLYITMVIA